MARSKPTELPKYLTVQDVMQLLCVGRSKGYEIIRNLNKELRDKGKYTNQGRVSTKYLMERYDI